MSVYTILKDLGIELPAVAKPLASYVPARQSGSMVYTSGQLPTVNGELKAAGKVGSEVTTETANECAKICILNALAAVHDLIGDLNRIQSVVKVTGFVASAPGFTAQPAVINGASDFLLAVFGDAGKHARSAVGVAELPKNAPVEIEMIVEIK